MNDAAYDSRPPPEMTDEERAYINGFAAGMKNAAAIVGDLDIGQDAAGDALLDKVRERLLSKPRPYRKVTMTTPGSEHVRTMIGVYRVACDKYLIDYDALMQSERGAIAVELEAMSSDLDRYEQGGAHETDCGIAHHRANVASATARARLEVSGGLVRDCQVAVGRAFAALPWPKP